MRCSGGGPSAGTCPPHAGHDRGTGGLHFAGRDAIDLAAVHPLAEVTLVLVLFHDAATVRLADLRRDWALPVRLLAVGFLAVAATWGRLGPAAVAGRSGALLLAAALPPPTPDSGRRRCSTRWS